MGSWWNVFDIIDATLDILSRPFDSLCSLELSLYPYDCNYKRNNAKAVRQASTILGHISHPPESVGSMEREYTIVFHSIPIPDGATIEACRDLEESLLRCSPCHIRLRRNDPHKQWLFWDRTMSTLFPVLHAKRLLTLESCEGEERNSVLNHGPLIEVDATP